MSSHFRGVHWEMTAAFSVAVFIALLFALQASARDWRTEEGPKIVVAVSSLGDTTPGNVRLIYYLNNPGTMGDEHGVRIGVATIMHETRELFGYNYVTRRHVYYTRVGKRVSVNWILTLLREEAEQEQQNELRVVPAVLHLWDRDAYNFSSRPQTN